MGRDRDAVRLSQVMGIGYAHAVRLIREACEQAEGESRHSVALRLIEAEEAKLAKVPVEHRANSLFQEPRFD
jgi:hypothetical protein